MKYMRILSALALALGLAIVALSGEGGARIALSSQPDELADAIAQGELVRLHIVADDDSDEAQRVKLCVRDAVLSAISDEVGALEGAQAAAQWLGAHMGDIERISEAELSAQGAEYGARAELGVSEFPYREYGGQAVPEGSYTALRIELGRAQGRNWWCVVYPTVCALSPDVPQQGQSVELHSALWDWLSGVLGL